MKVQLQDNKEAVELADSLFGAKFNEPLIHQVVTAYLAGQRSGTKAQKTRADVSASLLGFRARTLAGQIGRHNLVDERLVEFGPEQAIGQLDGFLVILELHFHDRLRSAQAAFVADLTTTLPVAAPGTAPLTRIRFRSGSTRTTSRLSAVRRTLPRWPDIFLPLKTRPGVWF